MRKTFKKVAAAGLCLAMVAGLAACTGTSSSSSASGSSSAASSAAGSSASDETGTRTIKIGTWYDIYYDSTHADIYADPSVSDEELAQKHFDALKAVEEKYNVKLEYVNLTYEGIQESINTSILAGKPDCDIYLCAPAFGIPAAVNGYCVNLEDVLPADADVLTDQNILSTIDIGIEGKHLMTVVAGEAITAGSYPLAFNKQMLDDAGLEDPNKLYENDEWTWDKFKDYLKALTKDTDGDGVTDVYGFGTRYDNLLTGLLFSNGTTIASTNKENVSSKEVGEVLDFIYNMYNVDKIARPWNADDWNDNQNSYLNQEVACWVTAAWISDANKDADLGFDIIWAPWPIGPSGNKETNATKNGLDTNVYMIPTGVKDPEFVYNVFSEYLDWYGDDYDLRDEVNEWWHDSALTEENFQVMYDCGLKSTLDLWNSIGVDYQIPSLLDGTMTAAQFQETNKQLVQSALDAMYN